MMQEAVTISFLSKWQKGTHQFAFQISNKYLVQKTGDQFLLSQQVMGCHWGMWVICWTAKLANIELF